MKRRTKAPRGYSACRISLIDLRAAAFQAAARVYPGASPYMYPARTTPGHWNTQCDVHWHYQFQRTALVPFLEYDDNHTYSHHAREGKASFPIAIAAQDAHYLPLFNCNPLQLNICLYRQKPSKVFLLPSPPLHHHVLRRVTRCIHRTRYVSSRTGRSQQCSSSDCWLDPTPHSEQAHTASLTPQSVRSKPPSGDKPLQRTTS